MLFPAIFCLSPCTRSINFFASAYSPSVARHAASPYVYVALDHYIGGKCVDMRKMRGERTGLTVASPPSLCHHDLLSATLQHKHIVISTSAQQVRIYPAWSCHTSIHLTSHPTKSPKEEYKLTSKAPNTPLHSPTTRYGADSDTGSAHVPRAHSSRVLLQVVSARARVCLRRRGRRPLCIGGRGEQAKKIRGTRGTRQ